MKIINTVTNEIVAEIMTNRSMTLDEAIRFVGEIHTENENEDVLIDGDWYYYDDLKAVGDERIIKTNVTGNIANEILSSVIGQMSDGMFEGSRYYEGFWMFVEIDSLNNICVSSKYGVNRWGKYYGNKFFNMSDNEVREFFARMIKRIVQQELRDKNIPVRGEFKKGNKRLLEYMNYREDVTIDDCVTVYDALIRN